MRSDGYDDSESPNELLTTYKEREIGKTLYRVTSIYKGEIDLAKALEDLTTRRILRHENSVSVWYKAFLNNIANNCLC